MKKTSVDRAGFERSHVLKALCLFILLVLLSQSSLPTVRAQPELANGFNVLTYNWAAEAAPGSQNIHLTISVQYNFQNTAQSFSATLSLPQGFTDVNGNSFSAAYISGFVSSGQIVQLSYYLNISPKAVVGTYTIPMTITWSAITNLATLTSVSLVQYSSIDVQMKGKVQLVFTPLVTSLPAGQVTRIQVQVRNNGSGQASQIQFSVSASSSSFVPPVISILNQIPQLSYLSSNSVTLVYLDVYAPAASEGSSVNPVITATYNDAYGNPNSVSQYIGLYVRKPVSALPVDASAQWGFPSSPINAAPGSSSIPLYITLSNLGRANSLFNVTMIFSPSFPLAPVVGESSSISKSVRELPPGSSISMVGYFDVSASARNEIYNNSMIVKYNNGTSPFTDVLILKVPVLGRPTISMMRFTYTPLLIYPQDGTASLGVYLVNNGTATATEVSARLLTSHPVSPAYTGSTDAFIGSLEPSKPSELTFALKIENSTVAINTTLTLLLHYNGVDRSFRIPFVEQPNARLRITGLAAPTVYVGDGSDYVTLTIKNVGEDKAQYAALTLLPSNVFQPYVPSSENPLLALTASNASIGTIMPGETVNATFVIQVSSNIQQGTYPLILLAKWVPAHSTAPFLQELRVPMAVHQTIFTTIYYSISNNLIVFSAGLISVIVVAAIVLMAIRKSRRA